MDLTRSDKEPGRRIIYETLGSIRLDRSTDGRLSGNQNEPAMKHLFKRFKQGSGIVEALVALEVIDQLRFDRPVDIFRHRVLDLFGDMSHRS